MNAQGNRNTVRRIGAGEALHLGRLGGELTVVEGRVWLTRDRDLGDHVVEPGQRLRLQVDENAVIEPARSGEAAVVRWNPRRQSVLGAIFEAPLRALAFLTALAAAGVVALARGAAAGARRAQGCIPGAEPVGAPDALK